MRKAFLDKAGNDFLRSPCVHDTCSELVSSGDDIVSSDGTKGDSLGVTWFKSDRGACGDVQPFSIGPGTIEGQTRISFDEVIVGPNL